MARNLIGRLRDKAQIQAHVGSSTMKGVGRGELLEGMTAELISLEDRYERVWENTEFVLDIFQPGAREQLHAPGKQRRLFDCLEKLNHQKP